MSNNGMTMLVVPPTSVSAVWGDRGYEEGVVTTFCSCLVRYL
jgi:hypothetical protein